MNTVNPTLIVIVGPSGAGKDTVARILSKKTDIPLLVSYTTRPMRNGEVNGREHLFVDKCDACIEDILAYTEYGGYQYWTTISQLHEGPCIYVIDEDALQTMMERFPDIRYIKIYVTADGETRRSRGVSEERMQRDAKRNTLPRDFYDFLIVNNKSVLALTHKVYSIASSSLLK